MPPTISVPKGRAVVTVREGSPAELQCEVRGKPRPPVLWSRVDKEAALLPSGLPLEETPDGKLRLERVSRDMSGTYRCQTARYNGFNVRPREAQVQLNVQCESTKPLGLPSQLSFQLAAGLSPLHPLSHPSPTRPHHLLLIPLTLLDTPVLQNTEVCVLCCTSSSISHLHFQGPGEQKKLLDFDRWKWDFEGGGRTLKKNTV